MPDLPSGTVTFLFTDIEGSTRLLDELGADRYATALSSHRQVIREACAAEGGVEVDTQGDAFFIAFPTAAGALAAAGAITEGLSGGPIRVRIGIHTGSPTLTPEGYVGTDVHRAARIAAAGHGGQVLVSSSTAALVDVHLRDLGPHRLKDLSAPERIHQLGDGEFAPLKSLYRSNLPVPTTAFVGRERELAEIGALLARPEVRLLTLIGPGGTGKTRLALQAAAAAADAYPDGLFWVPLAALRDPQLVLEEAARAVGAQGDLAEYVADKRLLLVFDNFEQVIEAAAGLGEALMACPNLRVLVTSRELLQLPGEQTYAVPPLDPADGTALFLARARALDPTFTLDGAVTELCARLEQLPLAIELAAARTRLLTPSQLLERISQRLDLLAGGRGVDPRQATLRGAIEWSHDLLSPDEQRLFARLAVFRGGWTLDAAEAVVEADLDTLGSLVDKSLVRFSGGRYRMLETIREYTAERLEASGEADDIRGRHADFFLALAEEAAPQLWKESVAGGRVWLDRLENEVDNLRTAMDWLHASGQSPGLLLMLGSLADFFLVRGHLSENLSRFRVALGADLVPSLARARALRGAGQLAVFNGEDQQAALWTEEALVLSRELGDASLIAECHWQLGYLAAEEGDWRSAQKYLQESMDLYRELGSEQEGPWIMRTLGFAYEQGGDRERAREVYEDGLRAARQLGAQSAEATLLASLAWLNVRDHRPRDAVALMRQSLEIRREIDERTDLAVGLCSAAHVLAALHRAETAASLIGCFDSLRAEFGSGETWMIRMNADTLALVHAQLDDGAFSAAWQEGRGLSLEAAVTLALDSLDEARAEPGAPV